jgi:hypothetical protein
MLQTALSSAEPTRMEVFRLLVSAQDMEMTVAESRQYIMHRFGVPETEVRQIEREGVTGSWPPL